MKKLIFLLAFFFFSSIYAAEIKISTDKEKVEIGENFIFYLELKSSNEGLNISNLQIKGLENFDEIGNKRHQSVKIINGKSETTQKIEKILSPKKAGDYTLGPASAAIGDKEFKSGEITLEVVEKSSETKTQNKNFEKNKELKSTSKENSEKTNNFEKLQEEKKGKSFFLTIIFGLLLFSLFIFLFSGSKKNKKIEETKIKIGKNPKINSSTEILSAIKESKGESKKETEEKIIEKPRLVKSEFPSIKDEDFWKKLNQKIKGNLSEKTDLDLTKLTAKEISEKLNLEEDFKNLVIEVEKNLYKKSDGEREEILKKVKKFLDKF